MRPISKAMTQRLKGRPSTRSYLRNSRCANSPAPAGLLAPQLFGLTGAGRPLPTGNRTAQHLAGRVFMSVERDDQERPCLHCMMLELIEDFFAEYPAASVEPDAIDTDEVVTAIAKTVAELTCGQDGTIRQQLIEQLMREIIDYDAEFRRDAGTGAIGSDARH